MTTLPRLLDDRANRHPDKRLFSVEGHARSYAEVAERAALIASRLSEFGIRRGDRVALILPNCIEMLELEFGLAHLGAIQVPLNIFLRGDFLRYQIADCQTGTVVCDAAGLEMLAPLLSDLPDLKGIFVVGSSGGPEPNGTAALLRYDALLEPGAKAVEAPEDPSTPLAIMYTSGTTGHPKGCVVGHGYYANIGDTFSGMFEMNADDVLFTTMPLYHNGGHAQAVMSSLWKGATSVFHAEFSASQHLKRSVDERATVLMGIGMMAMAMYAQPESDLDRSHGVRIGAFGPLTRQQRLMLEARFGFKVRTMAYGQTECVPITRSWPDRDIDLDGAGQPADDLEVRLVDDADEEVPVGEVGEIAIRPRRKELMFHEYWNNPQATLQAFRNLWYHTGDLGRFDAARNLYFVDRKKDAMRRRGENVSSLELEGAIRRFPKVANVAVHAVPSPLTEDDIKACIVAAPDARIEPAELFEFFRKELPYFAIPRYVEILRELPLTAATSRVQKAVLRERGVTSDTWDFDAMGFVVEKAARR